MFRWSYSVVHVFGSWTEADAVARAGAREEVSVTGAPACAAATARIRAIGLAALRVGIKICDRGSGRVHLELLNAARPLIL
jgi:hypothetical protein